VTGPFRHELSSIFLAKKLGSAANDHLNVPLTRLVEEIGDVDVGGELALVVPVADEDKLTVLLQLLNLCLGKVVGPQMLTYEVLVGSVNYGQVDE
jgi:hypothetical protein